MATRWVFTAALLALLLTAGVAIAQGGYFISWSAYGGAGGVSAGNGYSLSGTAGQAGTDTLSGGGYSLAGGYWVPSVTSELQPDNRVFLPTVMR